MPVTVVFLKDYEDKKKGTRARMLAPTFLRFYRLGFIKRVATKKSDYKNGLYNPDTHPKAKRGRPKKSQTNKKP